MISGNTLWILLFITSIETANILYVIPFSAKSHYISLNPIGVKLARRGHNVTVITAHKEKNPPPTYHEIVVDDKQIWDVLGTGRPNVFQMANLSSQEFHHQVLWLGGLAMTEVALNSTSVKEFLKKDNKFDIVISEQFFQEALNVLAFKYNAPLALVTSYGNNMKHNFLTGNPMQLATVISEHLQVEDPSSFWGRLSNLYTVMYDYVFWRFWYLEKHEVLVQKYFPELVGSVPSLYEIQRNASLLLINSHYSYDPPFALLPNIVEIGGIHLTDSKGTLPEDLRKILDESKNGFIYVNFGSNVRSSELPLDKKKAFINVFKWLKLTVIWKWEDDNIEDKPSNIVLRKWMPQREILEHPNIKMFMSHGGLIGTHEAIYNGVPLVGVPIYGDQFNNLLLLQQAGAGKILKFQEINEESLKNVLSEIINNNSYSQNMKEISRRFKDRPMTPLNTAVYWLEYVIRNNGAEFMKNPARNYSWFTYSMIDVYAFIFTIFALLGTISVKIIFLLKNIFSKKTKLKKM